MRETISKLDYVGFTFNNIHSSQFGLQSVSSGDRYSKSLFPSFKDNVVEHPKNGAYYFGSRLQNREFPLNLAFDDITEQEFREISTWLYNSGNISSIIFDELPYKKYYGKCSKAPDVKYLVFDDNNGARVYKGEMSLSFICYDVYGYIVDKWLDNYTDSNKTEWSTSSKLLDNKKLLPEDLVDYFDTYSAGKIPLYNPGDVETDFILTLTINNATYKSIVVALGSLTFTIDTTNLTNATIITVDTNKYLIKNGTTVINNLLVSGELFKIPVDITKTLDMTISNGASNASITYNYKYL